MKQVLRTLVTGLALAGSAAHAATLGTVPIDANFGAGGVAGYFTFVIGDFEVTPETPAGALVFAQTLTTADAGKTFVVTSGEEFSQAVAFLTNGVNDQIVYFLDGGGTGWWEAGYFYGDASGANGIDLAGAQIESISLRIDSVFFSPARDFEQVTGAVTISGIPPVPEPGTAALMSLGLAGGVLALRRARKANMGA
jgi:hypothetical protein